MIEFLTVDYAQPWVLTPVPEDRLAFRLKMRSDAIEACSITDSKIYEEKVQLAKDIARVLRMNVVQAKKIGDQDTWSM
jgi:peptide chain release factor